MPVPIVMLRYHYVYVQCAAFVRLSDCVRGTARSHAHNRYYLRSVECVLQMLYCCCVDMMVGLDVDCADNRGFCCWLNRIVTGLLYRVDVHC